MSQTNPAITLYIPGLSDTPQWGDLSSFAQRAFARASQVREPIHPMGLDALFLSQARNASNLATVCAHKAGGDSSKHYLFVDFIEYKADIKEVFCLGSEHLHLSAEEKSSLSKTLSEYLPQGVSWVTLDRDYLCLDQAQEMDTCSLNDVVGSPMTRLVPKGKDAKNWLTLQTEWQMLLFSHSVNQTRQSKGFRAANGVWIWGVYSSHDDAQTNSLYSDDVLLSELDNIQLIDKLNGNVDSSINCGQILLRQGQRLLLQSSFEDWQGWFSKVCNQLIPSLIKSSDTQSIRLVSEQGLALDIQKAPWFDIFSKPSFEPKEYFAQV